MKWLILAAVVAAVILWKRLALLTPARARAYLRQGAVVIDVRSEAEFQERHLPAAVNIPLGRLRDEIDRHAPNKDQPILLHCLSGGRSGIGQGLLKSMGYREAHNLGSYGRAEKILAADTVKS